METLLANLSMFTSSQLIVISLVFIWSGFVRTGLGFGGAGLALPFLLLIKGDLVFWLPIFGFHLLFFSSITVASRLRNVDWQYLKPAIGLLLLPKIIGVFGLLTLPPVALVVLVYCITLFYALTYLTNMQLNSRSKWRDRMFLILGGYMSGTSLMGAALIAPVVANQVRRGQYRDTLFVLWIILVLIKMAGFVAFAVPLNGQFALAVAPFVAIGHYLGLMAHDSLMSKDERAFKRVLGGGLAVVSLVGLWQAL